VGQDRHITLIVIIIYPLFNSFILCEYENAGVRQTSSPAAASLLGTSGPDWLPFQLVKAEQRCGSLHQCLALSSLSSGGAPGVHV
jgi:hypothetical protein